MKTSLDRVFYTIVRSTAYRENLLASDPYARHGGPPGAKRVVSFLRKVRSPKLTLPLAADDASVLRVIDREAFTAYRPNAKGPVFMKLIENALGTDVTTRTWQTVTKCAVA